MSAVDTTSGDTSPGHRHRRVPRPGLGRDFQRLWAGQGVSALGTAATSVALPLVAVATLDASAFQVALLSTASWLPWLLISLPAGAWVDRLRRRPLMVACQLLSVGLLVSVPVAAWLDLLTIAHLLTVALGAGTAKVFFQTAYQVYLPTLVPAVDLPAGNARLQGTEAAARVGGPGLAGLVAGGIGAVNALLVEAASLAVAAICLLGIRSAEPRPAVRQRDASLRQEVSEGIRFVARDPYLRVLAVFGAASNLGLVGYQSILVVFLVREVGVRPALVGGLMAVMSLGGVVGALLATTLARRIGTARAMLACELGAAPFGLLIPLTGPGPRLALAAVGGMVIGAGVVAGNVIKESFRQAYTPHHLLGRVLSSMQLVNLGAIPLGTLAAGALAGALGLRTAVWTATGWLALTGLILLIGPLRRHRDLPAQPAPDRGAQSPVMV
ncbi:MFS transporter [Plantactinospora sp. GCM10030261]|uniref:MFS transporter n=1 Tax=Plantactinospora sp. GCM10030261 TaxID=3273420 RepID=UPI00361D5688